MLTYKLTISSKNPKTLKTFLLFCFQNKKKIFNLNTTFYKNPTKIKRLTILKSPHVNKKAQTQLEYRIYATQIKISVKNSSKYLTLLKKIKANIFPDLKLKTQILISKQNNFQLQTKLLKPINFSLNKFSTNKISDSKTKISNKALTYLKLLDCFGEVNLNQNIQSK
jgi:ribosomal protein S10